MAGRGSVSAVGNLVEEDVILKGRAGLCVELGLFGEEHFQANSDSILRQRQNNEMKLHSDTDMDGL